MILPITLYGNSVLKRKVEEVDVNNKDVDIHDFIANLFETMYQANGVGLAAPQVDKSWAVFVIDTEAFLDEIDREKSVKEAFINPEIVDFLGADVSFNEGCLSVPGINEDVIRKEGIRIVYRNEAGEKMEREYHGKAARVIQHEYDHLLGKTFIERLSPLRRTLIRGKLNEIMNGKKVPGYRVKPNKK